MFKPQLVAVYGSLLKGLSNHRVLADSVLLGNDTVHGFIMYDLGAFPAILKGEGVIDAEIYEVVNSQIMQGLDHLEGHPNFYKRELAKTSYGDAWIYVLNIEYRRPLDDKTIVENGSWREYKLQKEKQWREV